MKFQTTFLTVIVICLFNIGCSTQKQYVDSGQIGEDIIVIGKLGVPVGVEVTIKGHKHKGHPAMSMFWVTHINDKQLDKTIHISVPDIDDWPYDKEATLKGWEVGFLDQPYAGNASAIFEDYLKSNNIVQNLSLRFRISEVISAPNMALNSE